MIATQIYNVSNNIHEPNQDIEKEYLNEFLLRENNLLENLIQSIPSIDEVSIGHALICDALYLGLENTIQIYKRALG